MDTSSYLVLYRSQMLTLYLYLCDVVLISFYFQQHYPALLLPLGW